VVRARELAHVDSNFGDHDLRRCPADAGHVLQALDGVAKGRQRGLDPCVKFSNGGFDLFDRLQVLADQETVVIADATVERREQSLARGTSLELPRSARRPASVSPATMALSMRRPE
jgi:hypothetical protein